jgi:hypothetical protein
LKAAPATFAVYSGDDASGMVLMLLGAAGVISVTSNVAPKLMHEMCVSAMGGEGGNNLARARAINYQLLGLHQKLFVEANPIPLKWAMARRVFIVLLAITLFMLDDQKGAVYAGFGTAGLLITADYAGSWQRRLTSYLVTGVIGTVVLIIGLAASTTTALAVAATALVAFLLAFISLLRGLMAVGSPAVLLVFIVAVTLGGDELQMAADVTAWWVAVIVSTIAALVILPHDVRTDIRDALAAALDAAADVAQSAWLGVGPTSEYQAKVEPLAHALDRLNATYDGKPFRPTGASQRDQALTLLSLIHI